MPRGHSVVSGLRREAATSPLLRVALHGRFGNQQRRLFGCAAVMVGLVFPSWPATRERVVMNVPSLHVLGADQQSVDRTRLYPVR